MFIAAAITAYSVFVFVAWKIVRINKGEEQ